MLKMMDVLANYPETIPMVKKDYEHLKMEIPKPQPRGRKLGHLKKVSEDEQLRVESSTLEQKSDSSAKIDILNDVKVTDELMKILNPLANCNVKLFDLKLEFFSDSGTLLLV
jgi:hypothetical protein